MKLFKPVHQRAKHKNVLEAESLDSLMQGLANSGLTNSRTVACLDSRVLVGAAAKG